MTPGYAKGLLTPLSPLRMNTTVCNFINKNSIGKFMSDPTRL